MIVIIVICWLDLGYNTIQLLCVFPFVKGLLEVAQIYTCARTELIIQFARRSGYACVAPAITSNFHPLRLPQNYLFKEKPQIARWDGKAKVWRTGGFQEVLFDLGV